MNNNGLDKLIDSISKITNASFLVKLNKLLAQEAIEQLDDGFSHSRDPYGNRWLAVKRGGQPLRDTARLQRSFTRSSISANGFTIGTNVIYAPIHQYGYTFKASSFKKINKLGERYRRFKTKGRWITIKRDIHIHKRQILPQDNLGDIWFTAFKETAIDFFVSNFK